VLGPPVNPRAAWWWRQAAILRMLHRHFPDFHEPELSASMMANHEVSTPATPPITTPATGISIQVCRCSDEPHQILPLLWV
jgi:hypothetical protein